MANLHCGRCGQETNDWAICQYCKVNDNIKQVAKSVDQGVGSLFYHSSYVFDSEPYQYKETTSEDVKRARVQAGSAKFKADVTEIFAWLSIPTLMFGLIYFILSVFGLV